MYIDIERVNILLPQLFPVEKIGKDQDNWEYSHYLDSSKDFSFSPVLEEYKHLATKHSLYLQGDCRKKDYKRRFNHFFNLIERWVNESYQRDHVWVIMLGIKEVLNGSTDILRKE